LFGNYFATSVRGVFTLQKIHLYAFVFANKKLGKITGIDIPIDFFLLSIFTFSLNPLSPFTFTGRPL